MIITPVIRYGDGSFFYKTLLKYLTIITNYNIITKYI